MAAQELREPLGGVPRDGAALVDREVPERLNQMALARAARTTDAQHLRAVDPFKGPERLLGRGGDHGPLGFPRVERLPGRQVRRAASGSDRCPRASKRWQEALPASAEAPPDARFPTRVRATATAANQQSAAFGLLEPALSAGARARELRRWSFRMSFGRGAGSRPGPAESWERFDEAVRFLGDAYEGISLAEIARAFAALAKVAHEIADALVETGYDRGVSSLPASQWKAGRIALPVAAAITQCLCELVHRFPQAGIRLGTCCWTRAALASQAPRSSTTHRCRQFQGAPSESGPPRLTLAAHGAACPSAHNVVSK